jgi:tRNA-2-methylthio-N6-dimethylallyladenosine synthase
MIGTTQRILVTGQSKRGGEQLSGRTECNRVVNFEGPEQLVGQFVTIHINESLTNSLRGRLIEVEA